MIDINITDNIYEIYMNIRVLCIREFVVSLYSFVIVHAHVLIALCNFGNRHWLIQSDPVQFKLQKEFFAESFSLPTWVQKTPRMIQETIYSPIQRK